MVEHFILTDAVRIASSLTSGREPVIFDIQIVN